MVFEKMDKNARLITVKSENLQAYQNDSSYYSIIPKLHYLYQIKAPYYFWIYSLQVNLAQHDSLIQTKAHLLIFTCCHKDYMHEIYHKMLYNYQSINLKILWSRRNIFCMSKHIVLIYLSNKTVTLSIANISDSGSW